jgi:hypothetical protein
MTASLRRSLAVGTTAALVFFGLLAVPAHSAPASAPSSCSGVWVVVQSDETNPSSTKIGCASSYTTGLDALQSAGFTPKGGAFLTQIDGLPTNTDYTTNGNLWWSHWTAPVNPDGTLGAWSGVMVGANVNVSAPGTAEGWRLTVAGADGPSVTKVFTPASSSVPASSSGSPSSSSSQSAASATPAAASSTPTQSPEVQRAATYLSKNLPSIDDGTGAFVSEALALSAARSCDYSSTIASLVASIKAQAADYIGNDPGRAANMAIFAMAVGEDPANFGGLNLIPMIGAGTHNGQVGTYASSFAQSLAVIAYVRAGQPVPPAVLTNLVLGQDKTSGAFGYSYGVPLTFYSDYDATGLAIEALSAAHGDSEALAKAITWAQSEQNGTGYWPNPDSPVDSTGILGSGLEFAGTSSGNAASWLRSVQLADGGFPASLDGTTSNTMATADAMWLLTGSNLVTVSMVKCSASGTGATVSISAGTGATTLADTGGPEDALFGPLAVSMIVIGAGMLVLRRRRQA